MLAGGELQSPAEAHRGWRDFRLLWGGQSVSMVGDQILLLALPLAAAQELGAGTMQVALLATLAKLPFLLIGLPAGVWVARIGLRRSMIGADLVRGLAVLSVPIASVAGVLTLTHLLAVALVMGFCMVFFQVAYQSYPPLLIGDDDRLYSANSRLTFSESTALLLGPGLAGLFIGLIGAIRSLTGDAISYAVSALTLISVRHRESPVPPARRRSVCREIGDGLRFVMSQRTLRPIMIAGLFYNFGFAMYGTLIAVFAVRHLNLQPQYLGLALGLGGIGFPLGSLLARRLARWVGIGPSLGLASIPSTLGMAIVASAHGGLSAVLIALGTFVNGIGSGAFAVNALTVRHLVTPGNLVTRATAVHRFATWGMLPLGSTVSGVIGSSFGIRAAMIAAAVISGGCIIPLLGKSMRTTKVLTRVTTDPSGG